MIGELQIPVVPAGGSALVAVYDFQQIPMKARLVRAEPFDQLGDIKNRAAPATEAVNGQACAGGQFASQRAL
ncbi:hypothetical protein [Mesorhizobium sp. RIZ17]|uniref:hypothetical protein n=1 Tax=Mesorhizobium sp. RIZ17 TaxID=3132743 RepID=UPI003DA814E2